MPLDKIEKIGGSAFEGSAISGAITLNRLHTIGDYAFRDTAITSVSHLGSVTYIPRGTFLGCKELKSVSLSGIDTIGHEAFKDCIALTDVNLYGVKNILESAFCHSGLTSLNLGDSVTAIGRSAFAECESLNTAILNSSIRVIPERAFSGCTSLNSVENLPDGLTEIGAYAFEKTAMKKKELRMPPTLTYVGEYAFKDADSPLVYVAAGQEEKWHKNWGDGCRGHGFLFLFHKVKTKKY
jgi:hypothetical protein